jgi:hypothetical protein
MTGGLFSLSASRTGDGEDRHATVDPHDGRSEDRDLQAETGTGGAPTAAVDEPVSEVQTFALARDDQ